MTSTLLLSSVDHEIADNGKKRFRLLAYCLAFEIEFDFRTFCPKTRGRIAAQCQSADDGGKKSVPHVTRLLEGTPAADVEG
jgi:hypothetical protein